MNNNLTKEIIKHIFRNFGLLASNENQLKITDNSFLLKEKIKYSEDDLEHEARVYGCECQIQNKKIIIFYTCLISEDDGEEFLYVHLEDNPAYCIWAGNQYIENDIYFNVNTENWGNCSILLQATFLAALESLKDIYPSFYRATEYQEDYKKFLVCIEKER